ncbi:homocysteine S-methyltransferase family protein [Caballeronia humi]|uniref:Homocysteine methyltransferase n=1 Tax=Caballeronia humi TaxID=326474 RepID=A0A158IF87_9BURK|nr:homocysteine S-methyltransferase family protein [Caballeronia humi]SAL54680.1 homocysteine methyltransferase [Caballeronia humi]
MSQYRQHLPQLADHLFLTDGGLETTLIFHESVDLPYFAAFDLLKDDAGTAQLERYYARYAALARGEKVGLVLETPTWRANPDWAQKLGYSGAALADANRRAVALLARVRAEYETPATPIVISGCLGPRGDGYRAEARMSADEARAYHQPQIETFAETEADMVAIFTVNYADEGIGVVRAARTCGLPVAVSFTLETDGRLPSGESLRDALTHTDESTGAYAAYYMINCAHPTHFEATLSGEGAWVERIRGVRANASRRSHAELDEAPDLDDGDPAELGRDYGALHRSLPRMTVVGGCCGTDHRHVGQICLAMKHVLADVKLLSREDDVPLL